MGPPVSPCRRSRRCPCPCRVWRRRSRLAAALLVALLPGAPALAATLAHDIRADCTEFCSPASQSVLLHLELDDSGAAPGQPIAPGVLSLFRVSFGSGQVATGNSAEVSGTWAGPTTPMIFVMGGVLTMFTDAACAGPGGLGGAADQRRYGQHCLRLTSVTLGGVVTPGPGPVTPVPLPVAGWLGLAGLGTLAAARASRRAG